MIKKSLFLLLFPIFASAASTLEQAQAILNKMTLDEKIAQKLMIDFRYWCDDQQTEVECTQDFTQMNKSVKKILADNAVGGVILFASNLKDTAQIVTLTDSLQKTLRDANHLPLFIATDQEGGRIVRLPQSDATNFAGNMALAAAYKGNANHDYAYQVGQVLGEEVKSLGINVDFAPDVDVNSNPKNPIIGVRSFGDDPELVALLGKKLSEGIQSTQVASSLKHFPGHGDTTVDSHLGLPLVNHTIEKAWSVDLYPFQQIINSSSPDMVLVAHIQYPVLDSHTVYANKENKDIMVPATLSRIIVTQLLRDQLHYNGVVVTDALRMMQAISDNFSTTAAVIRSFLAGNDIALMPVLLDRPNRVGQLADLIHKIHGVVESGIINSKELDQSVLRILQLKIKLGLLNPNNLTLTDKITHAKQQLNNPSYRKLEQTVADHSVTLVKNDGLLPIVVTQNEKRKIYLLMPQAELQIFSQKMQALKSGNEEIIADSLESTSFEQEKAAVDAADMVIAGDSVIVPSASDPAIAQIRQLLTYAKQQHKQTVYISLLSPYDLPFFSDVADAMLAGYSNREPTLAAEARVLFGDLKPEGKLPVKN